MFYTQIHTRFTTVPTSGGYVLLLASIIATLVTALGVTIASLVSSNLQLGGAFIESERAFFAAETVYECARYYDDSEVAGGTFDDTSGSVTIQCAGKTDTDTGGSVREFNFDWGASDHLMCSRLRIKKIFSELATTTEINAYGYNTSCDSIYNNDGSVVERVIQAIY